MHSRPWTCQVTSLIQSLSRGCQVAAHKAGCWLLQWGPGRGKSWKTQSDEQVLRWGGFGKYSFSLGTSGMKDGVGMWVFS